MPLAGRSSSVPGRRSRICSPEGNPDFDYARYLDELKTNRFNLTRVFSGTLCEIGRGANPTGTPSFTVNPAPKPVAATFSQSLVPGANIHPDYPAKWD